METRDWQTLKVLFREKNITRTADTLYISQPALTKRLQQMEKEFGVQIVHRGRRGVLFTPQGEYLVKCADEMVRRVQDIADHVSAMSDEVAGTLRLGVTNLITRSKLPRMLKQFKALYPGVEFQVMTGWSEDIYQLLHKQDIHAALLRGDYQWQDRKHHLLKETLCISSSTPIDAAELPGLPRIEYKMDTKMKALIADWWAAHYAVPPLIGMEVDKSDTCREMVAAGLGYAILPSLILEGINDIYKTDLTDHQGKPIIRDTWMFYHEEFLELKLVKAFVEFVEQLDFEAI